MSQKKINRDFCSLIRIFKSSLKYFVIFGGILGLTACGSLSDGILDPKGIIALEERRLFFDTLALMLIVVLPVIVMSITFVYHYRVSHRIRDYKPHWSHSYFLESLWWGIPCVIIVVLAILTWKKTHELDPFQKIPGMTGEPLLIQAIALPWKWLFIYPKQNIATINYLEIPVGQQVEYWLTTDNTPMSSFIIPQLGSQIYAMAGLRTRLFLVADQPGNFIGMNALFNGSGSADMRFMTHAVPPAEMDQWVNQVKASSSPLTEEDYIHLLTSSMNDQPKFYSSVPNDLFQNVVHTYMNSSGAMHPRENQAKYNYLGEPPTP